MPKPEQPISPVMDVRPKSAARTPRARVVVNDAPITLPPSFSAPPPRDNALKTELGTPSRRKWPFVFGAVVIIGILIAVGSSYFGTMHIAVARKTSQVTPSTPIQFTVPFTPKQFEDEVSAQASAKTEASPDTKATGAIRITNASQTSLQELVARTRFQSSSGNIYRLNEGVIVPAAKKSGLVITPSSITAVVTADGTGTKYNLAQGESLTIAGFAGTARAKIFMGITETPLVGGADKAVRIVHPDDVTPIFTRLETELKSSLANKLTSEMGVVILLPKDPYTIASKSVSPEFGTEADSFEAKVKGGVTAVAVSASDLSTALEAALFENFPKDMNSIRLDNPEVLTIVDTNASTGIATIRVQGDLVLTWLPNENRLKEDLQGKGTGDIESIFKRFESIASAEATFTPAWWPRIPKTDRISVSYR